MVNPKAPTGGFGPDTPRRVADIPGAPRRRPDGEAESPAGSTTVAASASSSTGSSSNPAVRAAGTSERRLIVGPDISLAGEITSCDLLVIEGRIEAKLKDCRVIEVAEGGVFKGSADIEAADVGGRFDGDLSVRGRLKVRGSGVISGNVRYGELEVEVGGRLIGTMQPLDAPAALAAPAAEAPAPSPSFAPVSEPKTAPAEFGSEAPT